MVEKLVGAIIGLFSGLFSLPLGKEITVFVISMLPVLELRGGLIAAALLGLKAVPSYFISIVGNLIPIPFILWFIESILKWMRTSKLFKKFALFLDKKVDKHKGQIEKYGFWGLVLFVGIPLPGTGVWTGCLIASVLQMDKKKAFLGAVIGMLLASVIMMIVSFGLLKNIIG